MHISTYSDDKAQVDINKLINNGKVQQYSGRIGCCIRNYLIFEKDDRKYYYNPNKLISDTLRKKLFNHLYNMSPKRLNKKTTIPPTITDETKERNKYADRFIKDLRKLKSGELQYVNIDYTKIKIKQSIKLIKLNIDDKKIVLTTDEGSEYFLNDRTITKL